MVPLSYGLFGPQVETPLVLALGDRAPGRGEFQLDVCPLRRLRQRGVYSRGERMDEVGPQRVVDPEEAPQNLQKFRSASLIGELPGSPRS